MPLLCNHSSIYRLLSASKCFSQINIVEKVTKCAALVVLSLDFYSFFPSDSMVQAFVIFISFCVSVFGTVQPIAEWLKRLSVRANWRPQCWQRCRRPERPLRLSNSLTISSRAIVYYSRHFERKCVDRTGSEMRKWPTDASNGFDEWVSVLRANQLAIEMMTFVSRRAGTWMRRSRSSRNNSRRTL